MLIFCFSLNAGILKWLCKFDLIHLALSISYTRVPLWYLVVIHWISLPFGTLRELYVRYHETIHILVPLQTIFRGVCEKIFLVLPFPGGYEWNSIRTYLKLELDLKFLHFWEKSPFCLQHHPQQELKGSCQVTHHHLDSYLLLSFLFFNLTQSPTHLKAPKFFLLCLQELVDVG